MRHRAITFIIGGVLAAFAAIAHPPKPATPAIALTFDDIPVHGDLPPGVTREQVMRDIVAALAAARAPAQGFVTGAFGQGDADAAAATAVWRRSGLPAGNHTRNHLNLDTLDPAQFVEQVTGNEAAVAATNAPGRPVARWFRYPFLSEGSTPARRDAARAVLAANGYRIAAVTLDFSDWRYAAPYARCMAKHDMAGVATLEQGWLAAVRAGAVTARARMRALTGHDVPLVLLMHVGAFDARMLPRTLALYRQLGFRFVPLAQAQDDPFYASANDPRLPGPSPSLERLAATKGLAPAAPPPAFDPQTVCA
jgi:peptidoglycan/xylan/chitin deacetylase (PgdA/CDA1 family)